jgi:hypothetical protein
MATSPTPRSRTSEERRAWPAGYRFRLPARQPCPGHDKDKPREQDPAPPAQPGPPGADTHTFMMRRAPRCRALDGGPGQAHPGAAGDVRHLDLLAAAEVRMGGQ